LSLQSDRTPTESMGQSLLYKLAMNGMQPGVTVDSNRFKQVYITEYQKVRIYKVASVSKESKAWVVDPANRVCDAPGSFICRGQYPPALQKIMREKKDFKQLEDFNAAKGEEDDSEYTRQYFENLNNPGAHQNRKGKASPPKEPEPLTPQMIEALNEQWEDNERTTALWQLISQGQLDDLRALLNRVPAVAHIRSEDGRGPMWWAYEYGQDEVIEILKSHGVSEGREDKDGVKPTELSE
jgi:dolichyl-diphosphooligosaccharide--protein glycosyltransferase